MTPFPLDIGSLYGKPALYLVFLIIGFAFGYVLEISGFNKSTLLAGQFYFRDSRVIKVMFTAIITALVLIFLASGLGLLDYNLIWVPPTYLWPGIAGGLIMGVGFILGGFCPGTSLVSAATLKLDGIAFMAGGLFGVFLFSETEKFYDAFFNGSYYGRLTLMDTFHVSTGQAVLLVIAAALGLFWAAEKLEQIYGGKPASANSRPRAAAWFGTLALGLVVLLIGQPTNADKWARMAQEKTELLESRSVQISPAELLASIADDQLRVIMLDVRPERDYNLFHLHGARRIDPEAVLDVAEELLMDPKIGETVIVLMSNDETAATEAWKTLVAEEVPNVYILGGGLNNWLSIFAADDPHIAPRGEARDDELRYTFSAALGDQCEAAKPFIHEWELEYEPKIKLEKKRGPSTGGCG